MRKKRNRFIRFTFLLCWKIIAFVIIASGVSVFGLWLLLPRISNFEDTIEARISAAIQHETSIGSLHAGWHGLLPYIGLKDIRVLHPETGLTIFHLQQAEIEADLLESLRQGRFMHGEVSLIGFSVQVKRTKDGQLHLLSRGMSVPIVKNTRSKPFDLRWLALMGQQKIVIRKGRVRLLDEPSGDTYLFDDVEASLMHNLDTLQVRAYTALPSVLGQNIALSVDVTGDVARMDSLSGTLYLQGRGLDAKGWEIVNPQIARQIPVGRWSPEVWANIKQGRLVDAIGRLKGIAIASQAGSRGYSLETDYYWLPTEQGWVLNIKNLVVDDGRYTWPATMAKAIFKRTESGHTIEVGSNFFRLEDGVGMLAGVQQLSLPEILGKQRPQGDFRQIYVSFVKAEQGKKNSYQYSLQADFDRVGLQAFDNIPGVTNLAGHLNINQNGGSVQLDTRTASLIYPDILRKPIPVSLLRGYLTLQQKEHLWTLDGKKMELVTPDLQIKGVFRLKGEKNSKNYSPHLNMALQVGKVDLAQVSNYFPVGVMKPKLTRWLEHALKGGEVSRGDIVFLGHVSEFPFRKNNGRFEALLQVNDGLFNYAPGWPDLHALNGTLFFNGARFDANVRGGVLGSEIDDVQITIKDVTSRSSVVNVRGHALGSPQDALDHLTTTPLKDKIGGYFKNIHFSKGDMDLSLKLDFPLQKKKKIMLSGVANLKRSTLEVATNGKPIAIDRINGTLRFTESTFSGDGIKARIMAVPADISIETRPASKKDNTDGVISVLAKGKFSPDDAGRITGFPWGRWMTGTAKWSSVLAVNLGENAGSSLSVRSDMQGISARFPPPFSKRRQQKIPLLLTMDFTKKNTPPWQLQYGEILSGRFLTGIPESGMAMPRAHFVLRGKQSGNPPPTLPNSEIIKLTGNSADLSWEKWSEVFADLLTSAEAPYQKISVNLHAAQLEAFQRRIKNVDIKAEKRREAWQVGLNSDDISGTIHVPDNQSLPIKLALDRLHLRDEQVLDEASGTAEVLSPNDLSAFTLESKDFRYNGMRFGKLSLISSRRSNAIVLDHLEANTSKTQVTGKGQWQLDTLTKKQKSSVDLVVTTQDAGATLRDWQYSAGLKGGRGEANMQLQWPGSPRDYSLSTLKGTINLGITNGRLLDIEPGAGRIFGLLSLQSFSKRLSLDFSDIFGKGFSFDRIQGRFSVHDGNAYSDSFFMEGPAAKVETVGRVGLVDEDYDQLVTVIPKVTSSLPVAGALAGGPAVGAAVFVIQKIFKPQIDRVVRTKYSVTGTWDKPVFKKLLKKQ